MKDQYSKLHQCNTDLEPAYKITVDESKIQATKTWVAEEMSHSKIQNQLVQDFHPSNQW